MLKVVAEHTQWACVAEELRDETIKVNSYDKTLLTLSGEVKGLKILDYGCGPGVLAGIFFKLNSDVRGFDISPEMRDLCARKISAENVYASVSDIPKKAFDVVICNLVLCIVDEHEVRNICRNIKDLLTEDGRALVGFCNPLIFNVAESQLDLRETAGKSYEQNHTYLKTKKEGGYRIIEQHRPLAWYQQTFADEGLVQIGTHFTPEYELAANRIRDFVIVELRGV